MNIKPSSTNKATAQTAPLAFAPRARKAHRIILGLLMVILSGRLLPPAAHAGHVSPGLDSARASAASQTRGFAHRASTGRETPKSAAVFASRNAEKMPIAIAHAGTLVPEPGTAVLLVSGALATVGFPLVLAFRRRRRHVPALARAVPNPSANAKQDFCLFSACLSTDSIYASDGRSG